MKKNQGAVYLVLLLVMAGVFIFMATAIMGLAFANLKLARHNEAMVSSLSVAEAGVNYYLWHLSHFPTDFCDGDTSCVINPPGDPYAGSYGPFSHDFKGPDGTVLGSFELVITPPTPGEKIYDIKSIGKAQNTALARTVRAGISIPSFAGYALLTNENIWVGDDEKTDGPVHSNGGIHYDYDGANDIISSSLTEDYIPGTNMGGDNITPQHGVWGDGSPTSWWRYGSSAVPTVSFKNIEGTLGDLLTASDPPNGIYYLPKLTGKLGYYLKLKANNKIEVRKVYNETGSGIKCAGDDLCTRPPWKTLDAPSNGVLYVDDYIWIDGTWNSKITIASSQSDGPSSGIYFDDPNVSTDDNRHPAITIKDNLLYGGSGVNAKKDGTVKIGLVAPGSIGVPPYAPFDLEIYAAMASRYGHVWYPMAKTANPSILAPKGTVTIYGSIASYQNWNWTYIQSQRKPFDGYAHTSQIYDRYLTIDPPPLFPTTGDYQISTWREE